MALVAHLLGLLVTFIGEPLTLRLLRDKWPAASMNETDFRAEGMSAQNRVTIKTLPTGVQGLDEILGGGLP